MAIENLVGLQVTDQESYSKYRQEMAPILAEYGGSFRCDFHVSEALLPKDSDINRVFIISFPDEKSQTSFFSHPDYLHIKEKYFKPAVKEVHYLAEFESKS